MPAEKAWPIGMKIVLEKKLAMSFALRSPTLKRQTRRETSE